MNVGVEVDERMWAHVPASFPAAGATDAAAWGEGILARYLTVRPDATADERGRVRSIAHAAVEGLAAEASFGLLFWPAPRPQAALVHVEASRPLRDDEDPLAVLLPEFPLALPPSVEPVEAPAVGSGLLARFVLPAERGAPPLAGIAAVVSGPQGSVRFTTTPTTTAMVGTLDAPLREVLATVRFVDASDFAA